MKVDKKNCGALMRITYYGRTFYFSTPGFMEKIMSADRANGIWNKNNSDVYSQFLTQASLDTIMTQQAKTLFQTENYDYVFDSAVGPVKTFSSQAEFPKLEIINKNKIKESHYAHVTTRFSSSGDYYECVFRFASKRGLKSLQRNKEKTTRLVEENFKTGVSGLARKRSLSPPYSMADSESLLIPSPS